MFCVFQTREIITKDPRFAELWDSLASVLPFLMMSLCVWVGRK